MIRMQHTCKEVTNNRRLRSDILRLNYGFL